MIKYTSDGHIFVTYADRSATKYESQLSEAIRNEFDEGPFTERESVVKVLQFGFNWLTGTFKDYIAGINDFTFVVFLFFNHESSIDLYIRTLGPEGEDLEESEGITEQDLSLNRRILRLALEQCCDVDYSKSEPASSGKKKEYILMLEDLLYLGSEIYQFAEHLAENRMVENCNRLSFNAHGLLDIKRNHAFEDVYGAIAGMLDTGFKEGIVSTELVGELRATLQRCMSIDYDFAGGSIFYIKAHHGPDNKAQTVQPAILPQNLIANGVDEKTARNFYEGLTLSRHNKLKIADSVYKVNSMERYFFRPILILNQNGEERALVGENKWRESIMVMATNGFQWQRAPKEWLQNKCFKDYLAEKSNDHDKLLENEVEAIVKQLTIPFFRNIKKFRNPKGEFIPVEIKGVGEMDFVFIDTKRSKIIVADSKYNRARYEMVGWSSDFKNFKETYEPQLQGKVDWLGKNRDILQAEFIVRYPEIAIDITSFPLIGMFIINTPTFYMFNGSYPAISINYFKEFVENDYQYPIIRLQYNAPTGEVANKEIHHPYFTVQ